jgi:phage terminase small subunit
MSRTKTPVSPFPNARLKPPSTLSKGAAAVFRQIVRSVAHDHFSEVDTVLIVEYARACDMANQADTRLTLDGAVIDGRASPWLAVQEKAQRAIVALCARLRLSPQSRFDRLKAGTTSRPQSRPWDPVDGRKRGLASFRSA